MDHFLIVGSMKAGTTSLHHWLANSDSLFLPDEEVHFFDDDNRATYDYREYLDKLGYAETSSILIGDDTPTYSYVSTCAERIASSIPDAKILWILRRPLDRAVSQYWHAARKGFELREIDDAFMDELSGKEENFWKRYLLRSEYLWQIENYLFYFDRERICFIDFHKFSRGDAHEREKIISFLNVPQIENSIPHSNKTAYFPRQKFNYHMSSWRIPKIMKKGIRWATAKSTPNFLSHEVVLESERYLSKNSHKLREITGLSFF